MELEPLLARARGKRYVLLGESTHGTHEFYELRAELTRRLIEEGRVGAVVAEADWPDAYRVNRYVRGASDDADAEEALGGFRRFPAWMWRNTVVRDFVAWLREWNADRGSGEGVGFYGMDLYSLHASIDAVIRYLETVAPEAASRARERYGCFDHARDPAEYGEAAAFGAGETCEDEAVAQLLEVRELAARDGRLPRDEHFFAEQNARLVKNAEAYYRTMFRGRVSSWNLRDTHMVETLVALRDYLDVPVAVWAHNSHLGDARATELGAAGEHNVGQLVRSGAATTRSSSASRRTPGRSPRPARGAEARSGGPSGRRSREAGRRCCTSAATPC
jgi:erythromycin esterase-like protein